MTQDKRSYSALGGKLQTPKLPETLMILYNHVWVTRPGARWSSTEMPTRLFPGHKKRAIFLSPFLTMIG